jgi:hypothetical protein
LPDEHRRRGLVVEVGAPDNWLQAVTAGRPTGQGPMTVVFFGLYTPLDRPLVTCS